MALRIFDYANDFETSLSGATSDTSGTSVGATDMPGTDADNEYVFYSGGGERARLDLNANLAADERVTSFNVTMELDINGTSGAFGNGQPDGLSFNLTDQSALPVSGAGNYESGAT